MSKSIFRTAALDRLSSPDQLDQLIQITSPKSWLALSLFVILIGATMVWAVVGNIRTLVVADGILLPKAGMQEIVTLEEGQITAVFVAVGDELEVGDPIAKIQPLSGNKEQIIVSDYTGRVVDLKIKTGDHVVRSHSLITVSLGEYPLEVIFFLPQEEAYQIQPGMKGMVELEGINIEQHGRIEAEISSVSSFPYSYEGMLAVVLEDELVQLLRTYDGPHMMIKATLNPDSTYSGYRWTISEGPEQKLRSNSLVNITVVVGEKAPVDLIWGSE